MKIGIDSYCYHRYFGEVYPFQKPCRARWTADDFIQRAAELRVDGVSLETCFLPGSAPGFWQRLKGKRRTGWRLFLLGAIQMGWKVERTQVPWPIWCARSLLPVSWGAR